MMTPFAQLGQMDKIARAVNGAEASYVHWNKPSAPAQGYKYQTTPNGLNNPYAPQVAATPKGMSSNFETAGDLVAGAAGMIPVVGGFINGAWQGGKAIYHGATGQYGKAAEDLAWGAAGFIPGAAMVGAVGKGARLASKIPGAARAISAARPAMQAAQPALQAARATRAGGLATKATPFVKEMAGDTISGGIAGGAAGSLGLKNNPAYQAPTAPPPTALNPNASLQDQMTNAMINGPQ